MKNIFYVLGLALALGLNNTDSYAQNGETAGKVVSVAGKVLLHQEEGQKNAKPITAGQEIFAKDIINTPSDGTVKILLRDKSILDIGPSTLFHIKDYKQNGGADRKVDLAMTYGTVRAAVTQKIDPNRGKFQIRTRAATMGVRGTEFIVKSSIDTLKDLKSSVNPSGAQGIDRALNAQGNKPNVGKTEIVVVQGKVEVQQSTPVIKFDPNTGKQLASAPPPPMSLEAGQKVVADVAVSAPLAPVAMKPAEITAAVATAKIEDRTFVNAITVDPNPQGSGSQSQENRGPASGSGSASVGAAQSALGEATQAIIKETVAVVNAEPPPAPPPPADIPGTFGNEQAFTPPPVVLTPGGLKRVRVVITR